MVIVLVGYGAIVWLVFFKLHLLPWNKISKTFVGLIGLAIVLVVLGLLNTRTPSGRITVLAPVVQVASIVNGTVIEVPVVANQEVASGDTLLRLDPRPFEFAVQMAKANFEIAEKTYQRKKTAHDVNQATVSQQAVDEAAAALMATNAQLEQALYNLEHSEIKSAGAGIVTGVRISIGDQVTAFTGVMPMIRDEAVIIGGVFRQNGWSTIVAGSKVGLTFSRYPGQVFWTTVQEKTVGTSGGQVMIGGNLLNQSDFGATSETLVRVHWPEEIGKDQLPIGAVGTATIIEDTAGPIGLLAKALLWVQAYRHYL